jgi:putative ABC transport system substrate-binding protein
MDGGLLKLFSASKSGSIRKSKIQNLKFVVVLAAMLFPNVSLAGAQQPKLNRVGVVHQGGPYQAVVDGLMDGLKNLGLKEGKHFVLEVRDAKGDLKVVEKIARGFERERIDLIYAVSTSVATTVRGVTKDIPIVFCVGSDPVGSGLVQSFVKPGGRLTGVHYLARDLTAKRLEILKELIPKLRRVVTIYDPGNRVAGEAAKLGQEESRRLGLKFVEQHAKSVEELHESLRALKPGEADAYFYISDAMVTSQAQLIIDTMAVKRLPTMFHEQSLVARGGLASYGQNYHEIGRLSAKYVQRVLMGTHPRDLRVETVDKFELVINLKTAKALGLTIPQSVLYRADQVIR